ncbi:MAG: ABC transporter ATP-binding protein [Treponema sp.]|nr:ABC transporter ATP-binding protein [Treponema sp.]
MVSLVDFTKAYNSSLAVDKVNMNFEKGKITGILGPNGAGKTTILKAICARHFATKGTVLVNQIDAQEESEKIKKITGFVEESAVLNSSLTVLEYLNFKAELYKVPVEKIDSTIKICSLEEVKNKKVKNLSKGYMERVNFAGALIYDPEVLILDEPATGLDPAQIIKMRSLVKELACDKTIILSTHLMQEAEALCDKIYILNRGKVLAEGSIEEICKLTGCSDLEKSYFTLIEKDGGSDE